MTPQEIQLTGASVYLANEMLELLSWAQLAAERAEAGLPLTAEEIRQARLCRSGVGGSIIGFAEALLGRSLVEGSASESDEIMRNLTGLAVMPPPVLREPGAETQEGA